MLVLMKMLHTHVLAPQHSVRVTWEVSPYVSLGDGLAFTIFNSVGMPQMINNFTATLIHKEKFNTSLFESP